MPVALPGPTGAGGATGAPAVAPGSGRRLPHWLALQGVTGTAKRDGHHAAPGGGRWTPKGLNFECPCLCQEVSQP